MIDTPQALMYARRSAKQDTHGSVEDQKHLGREVCAERGWILPPDGIIDEEVSASRYARKARPGWSELLDRLRGGSVEILILWESSRGDRRAGEWMSFLDLCQDQHVKIYVISHERLYSPSNHQDWKDLASQGVDNEHFSRRLSVEIKRGKAGAARRGRPAGQVPYGYKVRFNERTGKTAGWLVIPGEAEIVCRIVRDVGTHKPLRQLQRELTDEGMPSPMGGGWTPKVIGYIARNCAYAGLRALPDGSTVERQPQQDGAEWPAIVSREEWEKASAVLNARITGPRPGGVKHLMTCLAKCECGGWLRGGRPEVYTCNNGDLYVNEEWLDRIVRYLICRALAEPDARDLFVPDDDSRSARLRSEIRTLNGRRDKFRKMAAEGTIEPDAFADIERDIKPRVAAAERELAALIPVPALGDILGAGDTLAAWDGMTIQARREIIAAVSGFTVRKVGRHATRAERQDEQRVVPDWQRQQLKGPGGRLR